MLVWFILYATFFTSATVNKLEKMVVQRYWGSNAITDRPLYNDGLDNGPFIDVPDQYGMPSGHTEATALFCTMLYRFNLIDFHLAILLTFYMGAQRIIAKRHTPLQVIVGGLLGVFYAHVYMALRLFGPLLVVTALYTLAYAHSGIEDIGLVI